MPTSIENAAIDLRGVSFSYNGRPILQDITLIVPQGDYLGVLGPNGGGKTTLLKVILGLLAPSKGTVQIFGIPIETLPDRSVIGYISQQAAQIDAHFSATVEEIVSSGRTPHMRLAQRMSRADAQAIHRAMEMTEIGNLRHALIGELSGGQRQRVLIARALAGNPKILILDEPTTGIDTESEERFYHFLSELNRTHGLTIVIVSHDIDVVANEVKRVLYLNRTVVFAGTPDRLDQKEFLERLYGKGKRFLAHHH